MKEERVIIEKIQKTCKAGAAVTSIVKIFCAVMSVIAILAGIFIACSTRINELMEQLIASGELRTQDLEALESALLGYMLEEGNFALVIGVELIAMGIMLICTAVIVHFLGKVFKEMRESYSPFNLSVIKNLKVVFVLVTLLTLSNSLAIALIVGIAFWCVLQIFEYGCELQRQSDETL
ncbi:MAG: hypothetical protein HFI44_01440 [Lachnospiraceae bacterium]|nr:hypothetical protein [Lachnospiraceae bacterium]